MRAGIEGFGAAYGEPAAPREIRQPPLDGDPSHYARLCALEDGALPEPGDFGDYANDICYMETSATWRRCSPSSSPASCRPASGSGATT
jgi:hypothetical protein